MMLERRSLTMSAAMFYLANVGPVVVNVTLEGHVDAAVMDRAARLLRRDYPLLRCALRRTDDGVDLVSSDEEWGLAPGLPGPDALANELNIPLEPDRQVSRISLAPTEQGTTVLSIAADHAAVDGRLLALLLQRLLGYYLDLLRGEVPAPTGRPVFEGTLEDALLAGYEAAPTPALEESDPPLTLNVDADAPGAVAVRNVNFDQATTTALLAAARKDGISITKLLSGALACAVRARFAADAGPQPVTAAFAVDLRPRMVPAIAPDAPFCCAARLLTTTRVGVDDHPVEVGRRLGTQLQAGLERDDVQHRLLTQRLAGRPAPFPPISFMVSNIGRFEEFPVPDGLRVTDTRFGLSSRGPVPSVFSSTAHGRLNLDVIYDAAFHRADVIEDVIKHLETSLAAYALG
jgi:phenolphthiocerol/phthiocerol/phthiodiolone dimycocerosyl transferase